MVEVAHCETDLDLEGLVEEEVVREGLGDPLTLRVPFQ